MLSKIELLSPPSNIEALEELENKLIKAAVLYIDEVILTSFNVESVGFSCVLNNSFALASIVGDGRYEIKFGRALTSAVFNFSKSLSGKLIRKFEWDNKECIEEFIFNYICWFILNHELAHVTWGHLNYIEKFGVNGYFEVNEVRKPIKHLSQSAETSREYWNALESEADGNAISTTLVSFRYINTANQCAQWDFEKVLEVHGIINSLMFYFLNTLAEGTEDFRHPEPYVRQYLSLFSIDSLAEKMGASKALYTDAMVRANFQTILDILEKKLPFSFMIASVDWMRKLDNVLLDMGINSYRRRK